MFDFVFFVGALFAAFLAGVFCNSTALKNWLAGVPAEVQAALDALKAKALQAKKDAAAQATAAAVAAVAPTVVVVPAKAPAPAPQA